MAGVRRGRNAGRERRGPPCPELGLRRFGDPAPTLGGDPRMGASCAHASLRCPCRSCTRRRVRIGRLLLVRRAATGSPKRHGGSPRIRARSSPSTFAMQQGFHGLSRQRGRTVRYGTHRAQAIFVDFPDHADRRPGERDDPDLRAHRWTQERSSPRGAIRGLGSTSRVRDARDRDDNARTDRANIRPLWAAMVHGTRGRGHDRCCRPADPVVDFASIDVVWVFYPRIPPLRIRATADNDHLIRGGRPFRITRHAARCRPSLLAQRPSSTRPATPWGCPTSTTSRRPTFLNRARRSSSTSRLMGSHERRRRSTSVHRLARSGGSAGWMTRQVHCVAPVRSERTLTLWMRSSDRGPTTSLPWCRRNGSRAVVIESRRSAGLRRSTDPDQQVGVLDLRLAGRHRERADDRVSRRRHENVRTDARVR